MTGRRVAVVGSREKCEYESCLYGYHLPQYGTMKSLTWAIWKAAGRPIIPAGLERCPHRPVFVLHAARCVMSGRDDGMCICGAEGQAAFVAAEGK